MCGISVVYHKQKISRSLYDDFICSLKKIDHRGPDDEGVVLINTSNGNFKVIRTALTHKEVNDTADISDINPEDYNLILGHKRLSIIDLFVSGHQPMKGKDGSWIIFNGEIYNYIEVREELINLGCSFVTNSDTEVILEAYRIWGKDCLNKFNGMWSICIWDAPARDIFISNDRFGVKPLYFYEHEHGFHLISETKQLSCFKHIKLTLNQKHIDDFTKFGHIDVNEQTMYENVFRFFKSHYISIDPKKYFHSQLREQQHRYFVLKKQVIKIGEDEAVGKFRELLYDAVRIRMRADVNFGFALSGGLDSSAILYMARNILRDDYRENELLGFSAIFPGNAESDESQFVKIVAEDLPCKTFYSKPMDEFNFESFEKHVYHQDELLQGTSFFAQWSVYKKAAEAGVKILFNGQGADEVFAGYHHHFYRYCRQLIMQGRLPEYFSVVKQFADLKDISRKQVHKVVFNEMKLVAKMKTGIAKFDHSLIKYWNKIDTLDEMLLRDFDTFQLPTYLRVDDRNSMSFGLESRHPFMDYRLVEFGYSLPNKLLIKDGWQKHIIRKSMQEMPNSIRYRKDKKGFTTPHDIWLQKYKDKFDEYLKYNESVFGVKSPSNEPYRNYELGAWLKMNKF